MTRHVPPFRSWRPRWQLFYRVLMDNFAEMSSVVYTPTVGWACLNFSRMFRVARGMYFSAKDRGHMVSIAYNWPSHQVRVQTSFCAEVRGSAGTLAGELYHELSGENMQTTCTQNLPL